MKESAEGCRITNYARRKSRIFVDADACPVKAEVASLGRKYGLDVLFVASYDHKPSALKEDEEWIFVDPGREASDLYIHNHIKPGDTVITQDIGLASLILQKGAYAVSSKGNEYHKDTIDIALQFRYLAAKDREQGKYGKGPPPFTSKDRQRFQVAFDEFCRTLLDGETNRE